MVIIAFFTVLFSVIINLMKNFSRKALLLSALLILPLSIYASVDGYSSDYGSSPFSNPAYFGRFEDISSNPAALPLNRGDESFRASLSVQEDYNMDELYDKLGYIQNNNSALDISFFSKTMSMTVRIGSAINGRRFQDNSIYPYYDIYSNMDLDLSVAYAFPYISLGAVLKGGNSMARMDKEISGVDSAFANSFLSPFERISGSERFSVGFGLLSYFDSISVALTADDILSFSSGKMSGDLSSLVESFSLSFAAFGNEFTPSGDLSFVLPRVSLYYGGFKRDTSSGTFAICTDFEFQFLPSSSLSVGLSYREEDHRILRWNKDNGYLSLYLRGEFSSWSFTLGTGSSTNGFVNLVPHLSVSYAR